MGHCRLQFTIKANKKDGEMFRAVRETGTACFGFITNAQYNTFLERAFNEGFGREDGDHAYPLVALPKERHMKASRSIELISYPMFHKNTLNSCWKGMERKLGLAIKEFLQSIPQYKDVVYQLRPYKGMLDIPVHKNECSQTAWHLLWVVRNICHHDTFAPSFKQAWFGDGVRNPAALFMLIENWSYLEKTSRHGQAGWTARGDSTYGSAVYFANMSLHNFAAWFRGEATDVYLPDGKQPMNHQLGYRRGISDFFSPSTRTPTKNVWGEVQRIGDAGVSTEAILTQMAEIAENN